MGSNPLQTTNTLHWMNKVIVLTKTEIQVKILAGVQNKLKKIW
jgi:hypothetical protein